VRGTRAFFPHVDLRLVCLVPEPLGVGEILFRFGLVDSLLALNEYIYVTPFLAKSLTKTDWC